MTLKRIISLTLILCLVMTGFSTVIHAEEPNADYHTVATKLEKLGIIDYDKDADLNANITRKQIIPILIKYLGMDGFVDNSVSQTMFMDISSQDENLGSYALLYDSGYIKGTEDRKFYPDRNATIEETAAFLLRVMGYSPIVELSRGYKLSERNHRFCLVWYLYTYCRFIRNRRFNTDT